MTYRLTISPPEPPYPDLWVLNLPPRPKDTRYVYFFKASCDCLYAMDSRNPFGKSSRALRSTGSALYGAPYKLRPIPMSRGFAQISGADYLGLPQRLRISTELLEFAILYGFLPDPTDPETGDIRFTQGGLVPTITRIKSVLLPAPVPTATWDDIIDYMQKRMPPHMTLPSRVLTLDTPRTFKAESSNTAIGRPPKLTTTQAIHFRAVVCRLGNQASNKRRPEQLQLLSLHLQLFGHSSSVPTITRLLKGTHAALPADSPPIPLFIDRDTLTYAETAEMTMEEPDGETA